MAKELKPRAGRVALYYGGFVAAVVAPLAVGAVLLLFGPAPWILDRAALPEAPAQGTMEAPGASVRVQVYVDPEAAKAERERIEASISTRSQTTVPGSWRYRRADDGREGEVLRFGNVLLHAEGEDREAVRAALASLPFLSESSERKPLEVLFEDRLPWFFAGLALYLLLALLWMTKGAGWAGRIAAPAGAAPVPADELRRRLLEIDGLPAPFSVREAANGDLVAEWRLADAEWSAPMQRAGLRIVRTLRLRPVPAAAAVRVVATDRRASWSGGVAGLAASFSLFRGITFVHYESGMAHGLLWNGREWAIDQAYRYRFSTNELEQPLVQAVVASGWSWAPVMFLNRVVG